MPCKKIIASIVFIVTLLTAAHAAKEGKVLSSEGHSLEAQALIDSIRNMAHDAPEWTNTCHELYRQAEEDEDQSAKFIARYDEYVFYSNNQARYENSLDSVIKYGKLAMAECVLPEKEGLFYMTWDGIIKRLAFRKRYILAEKEVNDMMRQAKDDGSKIGLAYSYFSMAYVNRERQYVELFIDYTKNAIELTEKFSLDIPGLHAQYGQLALTLTSLDRREEAYEYVRKEYARAREDTVWAHRSYPSLCMAVDVMLMATSDSVAHYKQRMGRTIEELEDREFRKGTYSAFAKSYYYLALEDYDKCLESIKRSHDIGTVNMEGYLSICKKVYERLGDYKTALAYEDSLYSIMDSTRKESSNAVLDDVLYTLEEDKLSMENKDLQMHIQKQRMILMFIGISSLAVVVVILFTFLWRLREANKKLKAANAVKDDFIRNMSHEFRTPLNIINGFADILTDRTADNQELQSYSKTIQSNTVTLAKMVEDIIKLSAYDTASSKDAQKDVVPVTEFLGTRIALLRPRVGPDVDIAIKSADNGITAQISAKAFCDIFDNILLNAINCTTVGLILVSVERIDGKVSVEVSDTGPGIPEDKWEWIFGRFNKLDTFRRGAGLGLSIARAAAESAGAVVHVKSSSTEQPTGTTFEIILPPPERGFSLA